NKRYFGCGGFAADGHFECVVADGSVCRFVFRQAFKIPVVESKTLLCSNGSLMHKRSIFVTDFNLGLSTVSRVEHHWHLWRWGRCAVNGGTRSTPVRCTAHRLWLVHDYRLTEFRSEERR